MPRVTQFEVQATNPEEAAQFYTAVFGWNIQSWGESGEYWLINTGSDGPGINGVMIKRKEEKPDDTTPLTSYVCTVSVPFFDEYHASIMKSGGTNVTQKQPIPGIGWIGYYRDTEGNLFGLMQSDPSATAPISETT